LGLAGLALQIAFALPRAGLLGRLLGSVIVFDHDSTRRCRDEHGRYGGQHAKV
jgi:hypothetical protein